MDEAMLETRQFWFEDPVADDPQWNHTLQCYAECMTFWPDVPLPTDGDYTAAVLSSKDSAPGPDGLPYAAWRLDVTQSSEAMVHFMDRIQSQNAIPPVSVGVWIPKAKLGSTANYFRPLGMPSTFERLVDCTAAAVLARHIAPYLHPSQTVLNEFREPQQAVMAIQNVLDGSDSALVLSLDLSKAFERINPFWLLKILRIRVLRRGLSAMLNTSFLEDLYVTKLEAGFCLQGSLRQGLIWAALSQFSCFALAWTRC